MGPAPFSVVLFWVVVLPCGGYIIWRGAKSDLRPLMIPIMAWRQAVLFVRGHIKTALAMAAIIVSGIAMQNYFSNSSAGNWALLGGSLIWQAAMAAIMAALAVPLHLALIDAEPNKAFVNDRFPTRSRNIPRICALAGTICFGLWFFDYSLSLDLKISALFVAPNWPRHATTAAALVSFAIYSLTVFVRPSISSSITGPVAAGLLVAWRRASDVYLTMALMAAPLLLFDLAKFAIFVVILPPSTFLRVVHDGVVAVFSLYQFLAIEAATVILFRSALLSPADGFRTRDGEPARYADYRPY